VPVIPAKEEPPSFYGRSEREHPELYCTAALAGKVGKLQIQRFVAQMGESSHFRAQQLTSRYAGLPYSATIIVPLSAKMTVLPSATEDPAPACRSVFHPDADLGWKHAILFLLSQETPTCIIIFQTIFFLPFLLRRTTPPAIVHLIDS
jgi:hypothetical protein